MTDTPTGHDRIPDRYTGHGRETIDEMRDYLGDYEFALHCDATAMKYWRRAGKKGSADEDLGKMRWYQAMAAHVRTGSPDPRANRPGFTPYERRPVSDDVVAWLDAPPGELAHVPAPKPLPPDVPTVPACHTHGWWWQLGSSAVILSEHRGGLIYYRPGIRGFKPVDPAHNWLGPVTLRAVQS